MGLLRNLFISAQFKQPMVLVRILSPRARNPDSTQSQYSKVFRNKVTRHCLHIVQFKPCLLPLPHYEFHDLRFKYRSCAMRFRIPNQGAKFPWSQCNLKEPKLYLLTIFLTMTANKYYYLVN